MKAFFDKAKAWLLPVLIGLLMIVSGYGAFLYHHNTVLANTVQAQTTEITRIGGELTKAEGVNKTLADENSKLRGSGKITDDVATKVDEKAKELDERYSEMQKQVADQLKVIERKYGAVAPSKENDDRKAIEISLERSKGVWLMYCLAEPKSKECT